MDERLVELILETMSPNDRRELRREMQTSSPSLFSFAVAVCYGPVVMISVPSLYIPRRIMQIDRRKM